MTDDELVAWGRGYLAGWERAVDPENLVWVEPPAPTTDMHPELVERGIWLRAWRELVLAGVDPTEELIKERMKELWALLSC